MNDDLRVTVSWGKTALLVLGVVVLQILGAFLLAVLGGG